MTSIRKFAYATLVALIMSLMPGVAAASESRGHFTLTHEVLWGRLEMPAGEYSYAYDSLTAPVLTVQQLDGARKTYLLLVTTTDTVGPTGGGLLLIDSSPAGRYVSAMRLPEIGITLDFAPPGRAVIARLASTALTAGQ
jgi:hypothetical protein